MTAGRTVLLVVGQTTGGIGAHVQRLAHGLPPLGWRVGVLTTPATASRFDLGPDVLPIWPPLQPAALVAARRAVRGAAVVHAHGHQAGSLAALLVALSAGPGAAGRRPLVVTWHNAVLAAGIRGQVLGLAERWQARRADLVAGVSGDLVARARALGARQVVLDPVTPGRAAPPQPRGDGPEPGRLAALRAALDLPPGAPVLLTLSRIAPQKDLDVLVDAAAMMAAGRGDGSSPPVWLVAGDGDPGLLAALSRRSLDRGAGVRFLGYRRDVQDLLAIADAFVLPSRWEGRSFALQEAMGAGLPIVVTATGGSPDLVGEAAVLVPAGSPAALAEAAGSLLADPARARGLGAAARARFESLPTPEQVLADWADRYARLATGTTR